MPDADAERPVALMAREGETLCVVATLRSGRPLNRSHYFYDVGGHITRIVHTSLHADRELILYSELQQRDEATKTVTQLFDRSGDDAPEEIRFFRYDERGLLIEETRDRDADGTVDETSLYTYEVDLTKKLESPHASIPPLSLPHPTMTWTAGQTLHGTSCERVYERRQTQPIVTRTIERVYDERGDIVQWREFAGERGGAPEEEVGYSYSYVEQQLAESVSTREGERSVTTFERDNGLLTERETVSTSPEEYHRETRQYDAHGRILTRTSFQSNEATPSSVIEYSYSCEIATWS